MPNWNSRLWLIPMWGAYTISLVAAFDRSYLVAFAGWLAGTLSAART